MNFKKKLQDFKRAYGILKLVQLGLQTTMVIKGGEMSNEYKITKTSCLIINVISISANIGVFMYATLGKFRDPTLITEFLCAIICFVLYGFYMGFISYFHNSIVNITKLAIVDKSLTNFDQFLEENDNFILLIIFAVILILTQFISAGILYFIRDLEIQITRPNEENQISLQSPEILPGNEIDTSFVIDLRTKLKRLLDALPRRNNQNNPSSPAPASGTEPINMENDLFNGINFSDHVLIDAENENLPNLNLQQGIENVSGLPRRAVQVSNINLIPEIGGSSYVNPAFERETVETINEINPIINGAVLIEHIEEVYVEEVKLTRYNPENEEVENKVQRRQTPDLTEEHTI